MYEQLYNDLLPLEYLKEKFAEYFLAHTPPDQHDQVRRNIDEHLDKKAMYLLLPTDVHAYEIALYIKQTTNDQVSSSLILTNVLSRLYDMCIDQNTSEALDNRSQVVLTEFFEHLNIDSTKIWKDGHIDIKSKEYRKLEEWLKFLPVAYDNISTESFESACAESLAKILSEGIQLKETRSRPVENPDGTREIQREETIKKYKLDLDNNLDLNDPNIKRALITLSSIRKSYKEFTREDIETLIDCAKKIGVENLPSINNIKGVNDDPILMTLYLAIQELSKYIINDNLIRNQLESNLYYGEMRSFLVNKLENDKLTEDTISRSITSFSQSLLILLKEDAAGAFCYDKETGLNIIQIPIDSKFDTHFLIHEMTHALSCFDGTMKYNSDENSKIFNEYATDFIAKKISSQCTIDTHIKCSEDTDGYRQGVSYFSDFFEAYEDEIAQDFSNSQSNRNLLKESIGETAYNIIIDVSQHFRPIIILDPEIKDKINAIQELIIKPLIAKKKGELSQDELNQLEYYINLLNPNNIVESNNDQTI